MEGAFCWKSFENDSENRLEDDGEIFGVGVSGVFSEIVVRFSSISSINDRPTEFKLKSTNGRPVARATPPQLPLLGMDIGTNSCRNVRGVYWSVDIWKRSVVGFRLETCSVAVSGSGLPFEQMVFGVASGTSKTASGMADSDLLLLLSVKLEWPMNPVTRLDCGMDVVDIWWEGVDDGQYDCSRIGRTC